ncbi:MAG: cardiolipin synthase [Bacteroidia bacterium]
MPLLLLHLSLLQWVLIAIGIAYLAGVISAIVIILYDYSSPPKALAWIMVIVYLPIIGLVLYGTFGRGVRKKRLFRKKGILEFGLTHHETPGMLDTHPILSEQPLENQSIIALLLNNNHAPITTSNKVQLYYNSGTTFNGILDAIAEAKEHIHLEYYIFQDGIIGKKFRDALIKKAQEGVEIRIIYDAVGSWSLSKSFIKSLKKHGIQVSEFYPVRFPLFGNRVNYRNHRKIVVIDHYIGFVGGVNISDTYVGTDPEVGDWRDTHVKIVGEATQQLQGIFIQDWNFAAKESLQIAPSKSRYEHGDHCLIQIASSGPDSEYASIMQAYFTAINSAKRYVYISMPYFVPNEAISTALKTAALRGVKVCLLIPKKSDSTILNHGLRSYLEEFIEAGLEIFLYKKGFNHGKLMMVDGRFCSVGTANLDIRSFDQNFEVNALIYDHATCQKLEKRFENDIKEAEKVLLTNFKESKKRNRLFEKIARLFSPLL